MSLCHFKNIVHGAEYGGNHFFISRILLPLVVHKKLVFMDTGNELHRFGPVTIAVLFLLFGLSFIWFPAVKLDSKNIEAPGQGTGTELQKQSGNTGFEMPVDSFEQQLKRKIDEDLSEKE